ncbi:protein SULFUR DEFICIENCY-INDUCED 1-like [Cornus florida]|uniref:protein SULFUR DEFICIENCY-INDUCED 1-like n=1 Tax=Cornus florida TaxID=4283 RepID=UPI00289927CC|nr:protein SULFUR DEFICIENCY-INDUCED 1-like [Cornus florida]
MLQKNLGWAYMQKTNYMAAGVVYQKAQMIDPDANKACNLGQCLIRQARYDEARSVLEDVLQGRFPGSNDLKSKNRAEELLLEVESRQPPEEVSNFMGLNLEDDFVDGLEKLMTDWAPFRSRRLPIFEEFSPFRDQLAC